MPRSMTGFGQADAHGYHVEIKGVNHRFKDIRVKLPKDLSSLEIQVRDKVSGGINRGKVDVTVTRTPSVETKEGLSINWNLAQAYHEDLSKMARTFGGEVTFRDILLVPGVLFEKTTQVEEQWRIIDQAVKEALDAFTVARENEGNNLKSDIQSRVKTLLNMKDKMKALATDMTTVYKERLHANLNALLSDKSTMIDDVRLEQEVALLADRSDITEELVRLESHIRSLEDSMNLQTGPIGRHTDFLLQEISREVNTIGSKSQITEISRLVIDAKTEIEKIREQVQNIE
jgi:uncharacterized protein (TIGR00255 family)